MAYESMSSKELQCNSSSSGSKGVAFLLGDDNFMAGLALGVFGLTRAVSNTVALLLLLLSLSEEVYTHFLKAGVRRTINDGLLTSETLTGSYIFYYFMTG